MVIGVLYKLAVHVFNAKRGAEISLYKSTEVSPDNCDFFNAFCACTNLPYSFQHLPI